MAFRRSARVCPEETIADPLSAGLGESQGASPLGKKGPLKATDESSALHGGGPARSTLIDNAQNERSVHHDKGDLVDERNEWRGVLDLEAMSPSCSIERSNTTVVPFSSVHTVSNRPSISCDSSTIPVFSSILSARPVESSDSPTFDKKKPLTAMVESSAHDGVAARRSVGSDDPLTETGLYRLEGDLVVDACSERGGMTSSETMSPAISSSSSLERLNADFVPFSIIPMVRNRHRMMDGSRRLSVVSSIISAVNRARSRPRVRRCLFLMETLVVHNYLETTRSYQI